MFEITPTALESLKSYLQENNLESAGRFVLMEGGGCGSCAPVRNDAPASNT